MSSGGFQSVTGKKPDADSNSLGKVKAAESSWPQSSTAAVLRSNWSAVTNGLRF